MPGSRQYRLNLERSFRRVITRNCPMRVVSCCVCCFVLAGSSSAQSFRPDWHSGDYSGRNPAMWSVISDDLKTSFPRGGARSRSSRSCRMIGRFSRCPEAESNSPIGLTRANEQAGVILQTRGGQFYFNGNSLVPASEKTTEEAVSFNGAIFAVKDNRLVRLESGKAIPILEFGRDGLPDDDVRDIALSPDGELYVATASGIGILSKDGKWRHLTGRDGGLPVDDVTCLSFAADGTLWVARKSARHGAGRMVNGIIAWVRGG